MNHWRAAQRLEGEYKGKYDYTCGNRRTGTHPVGYCAGWVYDGYIERKKADPKASGLPIHELEEMRDAALPFKDKYHNDGHNTIEEAQNCYRLYKLDRDLRFNKPSPGVRPHELHTCESSGCKNYTANLAQIAGGGIACWYLCNDHLNREAVEHLYKVGESWGSY